MKADPGRDVAHVSRSGKGAIAVRRAEVALGTHPIVHAGCTRVRKTRCGPGKAKAIEAASAGSAAAIAATRIPIALGLAAEGGDRRTGIAAPCCLTVVSYGDSRGKGSEPEQSFYDLAAVCGRSHSTHQSVELSIVHEPSFWIAMP
jgi:hypothetical protein